MGSVTQKEEEVSLIAPVMAMKSRKVLKGHRGKVLHFDWSADKSHVLTAGQVSGNTCVYVKKALIHYRLYVCMYKLEIALRFWIVVAVTPTYR